MSQLSQTPELLDLSITLTPPPKKRRKAAASAEVIASITVRCDALGLTQTGDLLSDPLTKQDREELRWYLEEYWQWPYEQFLTHGKRVEALLAQLGKRLYESVFKSTRARDILQAWRLHPDVMRQISIVSDIPGALSLPWELLHDEQGFLVLRTKQPVPLVRRLPQRELAAFATAFEPPLRILLVTARPEGAGFIDPRGIARELLDEVQNHINEGSIAVEFLRPPTLRALRARLSDTKRPSVHILHFDGHGAYKPEELSQDGLRLNGSGMGILAFENDEGKLELIDAGELAQVLQDSGVQLAVLNACQSDVGASDDAFSSVATKLIAGGVDAVVAMGASVLVVSAARFVEAFYREMANGTPVPIAQERARQALHDDRRRHVHRRSRDEEGKPVELRDWWLPHFYSSARLCCEPPDPLAH